MQNNETDSRPRSCIICHVNPAELPDRNTVSRTKKVCRTCHSARLAGDLKAIVAPRAVTPQATPEDNYARFKRGGTMDSHARNFGLKQQSDGLGAAKKDVMGGGKHTEEEMTAPAKPEGATPTPARIFTAHQMAQRLASVVGIDRWALMLAEWLDSYVSRWKADEEIRAGEPEGAETAPALLKALEDIVEHAEYQSGVTYEISTTYVDRRGGSSHFES